MMESRMSKQLSLSLITRVFILRKSDEMSIEIALLGSSAGVSCGTSSLSPHGPSSNPLLVYLTQRRGN